MPTDPYFEVKSEVESTLQVLSTLSASYARIVRTVPKESQSSSEELAWSLAELKATLASLEGDVVELEESVAAIEEHGAAQRLSIEADEVKRRRAFLSRARYELEAVRKTLPRSAASLPELGQKHEPKSSTFIPDDSDEELDPEEHYEMQNQTYLIQQQDRTLTDISGTVGLLRQQAKVMGQEVFEQNIMLEALDEQVDLTTGNLGRAQRRMQAFIKQNQDSPSSWCILMLIIILTILLFVILFL